MLDSMIKVACVSPLFRNGDCTGNAALAVETAKNAADAGCALLVYPEMSLTGVACGDLSYQRSLTDAAWQALEVFTNETASLSMICVLCLPVVHRGSLFSCAAVVYQGKILALIPRNFDKENTQHNGIPFGEKFVFTWEENSDFSFGVDLSDNVVRPVSAMLCASGAAILAKPMALTETEKNADRADRCLLSLSQQLSCAYVAASPSVSQSSGDSVYSGHCFLCECGERLARTVPYETGILVSEIDTGYLLRERAKRSLYAKESAQAEEIRFSMEPRETAITRHVDSMPFVPSREQDVEAVFDIQVHALVERLRHIHCERVVLGLSGGLDSTLALLVCAAALNEMGLPAENCIAVTMPCFGTGKRTYNNALVLARETGAMLLEINICDSVRKHFEDIGHDEWTQDVTYENAQARERTQVLMDLANQENAIVVGTGDLSELALGWATYNGDHMSMFAVNASLTKTLIRAVVDCAAKKASPALQQALWDVLDTPVSPELLPGSGELTQQTEDIVGPYELHDFFLYHLLDRMENPSLTVRLAQKAFEGKFDERTIHKWMGIFLRRFFRQQFKRSCMPEGPKVGAVSLSPRGDWSMPSDFDPSAFLEE